MNSAAFYSYNEFKKLCIQHRFDKKYIYIFIWCNLYYSSLLVNWFFFVIYSNVMIFVFFGDFRECSLIAPISHDQYLR